jgi:thiamine-phosphate pyrophosphorylase
VRPDAGQAPLRGVLDGFAVLLSRLYAIVDADVLKARGVRLRKFAVGLRAAGVSLVQYRDKSGSPAEVLAGAAVLREVFGGEKPHGRRDEAAPIMGHPQPLLIMNDRADLAVLAGFDGVHVGQGDLLPEDAKAVVRGTIPTHRMGQERDEWGTQFLDRPISGEGIVGVSTHTEAQVRVAELSCADYVAIGPVFATGTKVDAEAVVGLEGVRRARALTAKPLVAIGGITRENARSVVDAGADSVAVISGLFVAGESVEKVARDFLELLG